MSIRLNKALSDLNIGLQTAVDFLEKRPDLGEVKNEVTFKLNDKQYDALVAAFKSDKEVRVQAEKLQKKPEKKKQDKDKNKQDVKKSSQAVTPGDSLVARKEVKPLGKIDLSTAGKPAKSNNNAKPQQQNNAETRKAMHRRSLKFRR